MCLEGMIASTVAEYVFLAVYSEFRNRGRKKVDGTTD